MQPSLHRGEIDRATAEPGPAQGGECFVAHQQATHAGGIAEHLVERHHHEVRRHGAQVQAAGRHVGGCVQQHVPPARAGRLHPFERVLDPGEIRLRRKREQPGLIRVRLRQQRVQRRLVEAQLGAGQGRIVHRGATALRELPDAVDRVVVVRGQQKPPTGRERVGLTHQLERPRGVEREDGGVGTGAAKVRQHGGTRLFHPAGGLHRTRVGRVRVAQHLFGQHRRMFLHLAGRVQAGAGVVQVHLIQAVQPGVLRGAQLVQGEGGGVVGEGGQEVVVRRHGPGLSGPAKADGRGFNTTACSLARLAWNVIGNQTGGLTATPPQVMWRRL